MGEGNILRLTGVIAPLRLPVGSHVLVDEVLFRRGGAHGNGMAARALIDGGKAGEGAVIAKRVTVFALGAGFVGVDFMAEVHGLRPASVNGAWKADPARAQGHGQSGQKRDFSA